MLSPWWTELFAALDALTRDGENGLLEKNDWSDLSALGEKLDYLGGLVNEARVKAAEREMDGACPRCGASPMEDQIGGDPRDWCDCSPPEEES